MSLLLFQTPKHFNSICIKNVSFYLVVQRNVVIVMIIPCGGLGICLTRKLCLL